MMEDAGEVKFSCGYVETKAKLIVEINEEWRNSLKGGKLLIQNLIKSLEWKIQKTFENTRHGIFFNF